MRYFLAAVLQFQFPTRRCAPRAGHPGPALRVLDLRQQRTAGAAYMKMLAASARGQAVAGRPVRAHRHPRDGRLADPRVLRAAPGLADRAEQGPDLRAGGAAGPGGARGAAPAPPARRACTNVGGGLHALHAAPPGAEASPASSGDRGGPARPAGATRQPEWSGPTDNLKSPVAGQVDQPGFARTTARLPPGGRPSWMSRGTWRCTNAARQQILARENTMINHELALALVAALALGNRLRPRILRGWEATTAPGAATTQAADQAASMPPARTPCTAPFRTLATNMPGNRRAPWSTPSSRRPTDPSTDPSRWIIDQDPRQAAERHGQDPARGPPRRSASGALNDELSKLPRPGLRHHHDSKVGQGLRRPRQGTSASTRTLTLTPVADGRQLTSRNPTPVNRPALRARQPRRATLAVAPTTQLPDVRGQQRPRSRWTRPGPADDRRARRPAQLRQACLKPRARRRESSPLIDPSAHEPQLAARPPRSTARRSGPGDSPTSSHFSSAGPGHAGKPPCSGRGLGNRRANLVLLEDHRESNSSALKFLDQRPAPAGAGSTATTNRQVDQIQTGDVGRHPGVRRGPRAPLIPGDVLRRAPR